MPQARQAHLLRVIVLFVLLSPAVSAQPDLTPQIRLLPPVESTKLRLDDLSDDELVQLYESEYRDSLVQQSVDQSRLVSRQGAVIEIGYSFSDRTDDLGFEYQTHTFPELLLRYRVRDSIELRLGWAGTTSDIFADPLTGFEDHDQTLADPSFGVRFALFQQNGWRPTMSLTTSTSVAMNDRNTAGSGFRPQAALSYSWLTGPDCLLTGSTGVTWITAGPDDFFDLQQSIALNYFVNDRWDVFIEWFAVFPGGDGGLSAAHSAGPGVSCALNDRLQLTLNAAAGLNDAASDVLAQVRVAWRL